MSELDIPILKKLPKHRAPYSVEEFAQRCGKDNAFVLNAIRNGNISFEVNKFGEITIPQSGLNKKFIAWCLNGEVGEPSRVLRKFKGDKVKIINNIQINYVSAKQCYTCYCPDGKAVSFTNVNEAIAWATHNTEYVKRRDTNTNAYRRVNISFDVTTAKELLSLMQSSKTLPHVQKRLAEKIAKAEAMTEEEIQKEKERMTRQAKEAYIRNGGSKYATRNRQKQYEEEKEQYLKTLSEASDTILSVFLH